MQYYSEISSMLFIDQLNNSIELTNYPKRIISLVPSQSELLWDLGLREELVGITKFCIHPHTMFTSVERVGGTKQLNLEKIRDLKPDLIIANKEENEQSQIEELQKEFNVWISDIYNLKDALQMIQLVGDIVNKTKAAHFLVEQISQTFKELKQHQGSVLYLIWRDPYMAVGKDTFIGDMLQRMGLHFDQLNKRSANDNYDRYPTFSIEDIKALNPKFVFLSSEPYPFKENHIVELQQHVPDSKIILVDGELFSWYGSRLLHSAAYFNQIL